jgi:hypothetical protein
MSMQTTFVRGGSSVIIPRSPLVSSRFNLVHANSQGYQMADGTRYTVTSGAVKTVGKLDFRLITLAKKIEFENFIIIVANYTNNIVQIIPPAHYDLGAGAGVTSNCKFLVSTDMSTVFEKPNDIDLFNVSLEYVLI